jgi:hypothetical protein
MPYDISGNKFSAKDSKCDAKVKIAQRSTLNGCLLLTDDFILKCLVYELYAKLLLSHTVTVSGAFCCN